MTARLIRCRQLKREAETGIAHVYVPTTNGANCNGQWRRSRLTLLVKGPKYGDHLAQEAHSKSVPVITGHDVLDSLSRTGTPTRVPCAEARISDNFACRLFRGSSRVGLAPLEP
jgi:hypothetical protein